MATHLTSGGFIASVNKEATHKFVMVLNEKAPIGKLLSATGQLAISLYLQASAEEKAEMNFVDFFDPSKISLVTLSLCSFVVLKGRAGQMRTLYSNARESGILSAIFTETMSYSGIEEDLMEKTALTPIDQAEPYGVGLFSTIEILTPLTKKFSVFK